MLPGYEQSELCLSEAFEFDEHCQQWRRALGVKFLERESPIGVHSLDSFELSSPQLLGELQVYDRHSHHARLTGREGTEVTPPRCGFVVS